jgi:ubiquinone/menaquinone biosynthesis C-methylase UbiE
VPVLAGAVAEIHRVLRPGGIALSLDFDRPSNAIVRSVYVAWLTVVGSALGYVLHRDPETYRYIPRSIVRYPGAAAVAELMRAHGFSEARAIPLLGGLMAIHTARK